MPRKILAKKQQTKEQQNKQAPCPNPAKPQEDDEVKDLVVAFNKIPRAYKPNGQFINHWHFTVRHIPTGDFLQIVNPESRASHTEGPATIPALIEDQAKTVFQLLLKAFVKSICNTFAPPMAPWSWGTRDEDLAVALRAILSAGNIRSGLCKISFGDENHITIAEEIWKEECGKLVGLAKSLCRNCKKAPTGKQAFKHCSSCKQVKYCSKDCQRADWKEHKKFCKLLTISKSITSSYSKSTEAAYDAQTYFERTASNSPFVKTLARDIGLKLSKTCVRTLIRRLVITGNDTPAILINFFGKHPTDREDVDDIHHETRMEILLQPPKGSYYYVFAKSHNIDENCPAWTPREASEEEEDDLDHIKYMRTVIKRYMAARNRRLNSIDNEDMEDIIFSVFVMDDIDEMEYHRKYYIAALNSLDLGYPTDHNPCKYKDQARTLRHWGLPCN